MSTMSIAESPHQEDTLQNEIIAMFNELPPDAKMTVKQFIMFLADQSQKHNVSRQHTPIVAVPASSLENWTGLLTIGYEGNALEDTESLYDEV